MSFYNFFRNIGALSSNRISKAKKRLMQELNMTNPNRIELDLEILRQAVDNARNVNFPNRQKLYAIYELIAKDSHLASQIRTAIQNVLQANFVIQDNNGKTDKDATKLLNSTWFIDFCKLMLEAEFWGHSLVEFSQLNKKGRFEYVQLIPRKHVIPEKGIVTIRAGQRTGIEYRKDIDTFALIEHGKHYDLGILELCAKEVITKNYARTDWSQASERYGMPLLKIKTNTKDDKEITRLQEMAQNFAAAGYIILSQEDEAEFEQVKETDYYKIYLENIKLCDNQISKLINGQTGTADEKAYVGAAEVHERILNNYTRARMTDMEYLVNQKLIPFLQKYEYPLSQEKHKFVYTELHDENKTAENTKPEKKKQNQTDKLSFDFNDFFVLNSNEKETVNTHFLKKFLKRIFDKKTKKLDKEIWLKNYNKLADAIDESFVATDFGEPDWMLVQNLKYNAATFAAFKNHDEIKKIQNLIQDGDGVKKWETFRDEALKLSENYNINYLKTEYNHAVQSARMARKWQDLQADTDLYPNLKYIAVNDKRTRESHKKLHGAIYPVNHEFWDIHTPPNGYGCRCSIRPTSEPAKEASEIPVLAEMFQNNVGKTGMIFTEKHNYFKGATKAQKAFIENAVGKIIKPPEVVKKSYERYKRYGKDYIKPDNSFNFDNGGYVVYHKDHQFHKKNGKYEKKTAEILKDNGEQVSLESEKKAQNIKTPDGIIGDYLILELKTILSKKPNSIKRNVEIAARQGADIVVLYLNEMDTKNLYTGLAKWQGVAKKENLEIKIMYVKNGELYKI